MKQQLVAITFVCAAAWSATALAQLPAGDLRLWLKADSLGLAEGAQVTQWTDSSSHATSFSPRTSSEPDGPLGGFPLEENPHFQTVTANGRTFATVKFDRDGDIFSGGDPAVDGSGSTDRLYQTNNRTPGSDPLVIADGTSYTSFTVLKPNVTTPPVLGFQNVWGLRGNGASLYTLGIAGGGPLTRGHYNYVTYDAQTSYIAGANPATAGVWQIVMQSVTEQGANDLLQFAVNDTGNFTNPLSYLSVTNGGLIMDRNDGINEDPTGLVEPFGIGAHAQDCCGEGETFAGNIAEVIIFAGDLSAGDVNQIYSYLGQKYFVPEPGAFGLMMLGVMGLAATRRRVNADKQAQA